MPNKRSLDGERQAFTKALLQIPVDKPIDPALGPAIARETELRKLFAQTCKGSSVLDDPHVGLVNVFSFENSPNSGPVMDPWRIHDRAIPSSDPQVVCKLEGDLRLKTGDAATCGSMAKFKKNFSIFTEDSLSQIQDWSNIVVAGGSVLAALAPLPAGKSESRRSIRKYYTEGAYCASDVDLFIYGLNQEEAEKKMDYIYKCILDAVAFDVTCIRTKNTVTIVTDFPTKHVQIVLRLYTSPAEILMGFDVDCCSVAYDGKNVWATPRAMGALMEQCNRIDMTRRSPSYEVRLIKYASRGFEIVCPGLNRERIDPTIYNRSIFQIQGLARLLVLEKLTSTEERNIHLQRQRKQSGRPMNNRMGTFWRTMGDLKLKGEILPMSEYDTLFHIPYGPKYNASKLTRLLYRSDFGLNSEFNPKNKDRILHRHPVFMGTMTEVFEDLCQHCPTPRNDEEKEQQAKEDEKYVRGRISFMTINPGQQLLSGSFHPIDEGEWKEQAYLCANHNLFESIASQDLQGFEKAIESADQDISSRDHVGRTALHLAIQVGNEEMACKLVQKGIRISARLKDGMSGLHLAAEKGMAKLISEILAKNEINRKEIAEKGGEKPEGTTEASGKNAGDGNEDGDEDGVDEEEERDYEEARSVVGGPMKSNAADDKGEADEFDDDLHPDVYEGVDVVAWDAAIQPIHLAVLSGSTEATKVLIDAGADVKATFRAPTLERVLYNMRGPLIFPLTCAAFVEDEGKAIEMIKFLVEHGARSSHADKDCNTVLLTFLETGRFRLVQALFELDPTAKLAINISALSPTKQCVFNPVHLALVGDSPSTLLLLLQYGAKLKISMNDFSSAISHIKNSPFRSGDEIEFFRRVPRIVEVAIANLRPEWKLLQKLGAEVPDALLGYPNEWVRGSYGWRGPPRESLKDHVVRVRAELAEKSIDAKKAKFKEERELIRTLRSQMDYSAFTTLCHLGTRHDGLGARYEDAVLDPGSLSETELQAYEEFNPPDSDEDLEGQKRAEAFYADLHKYIESEPSLNKTWDELPISDGRKRDPKNERSDPESHLKIRFSRFKGPGTHYYYSYYSDDQFSERAGERYLDLFNMIWKGDLEGIRELTSFGENPASEREKTEAPLLLDVVHSQTAVTPFIAAALAKRGDVLELLVEIATNQYTPDPKKDENDRARQWMGQQGYDEDDYSEAGSDILSDDDTPGSSVAEEEAKDVTALKKAVTTSTHPMKILAANANSNMRMILAPAVAARRLVVMDALPRDNESTPDPLEISILLDDEATFEFIRQRVRSNEDFLRYKKVNPERLAFAAIAADSKRMLQAIIEEWGAGLDFDTLAQKMAKPEQPSGDIASDPQPYKGLLLNGERKKGGFGIEDKKVGLGNLPSLLHYAARAGALDCVDYLTWDGLVESYRRFIERNPGSERAKILSEVEDLEATVINHLGLARTWLNETVFHASALGGRDQAKVIALLIKKGVASGFYSGISEALKIKMVCRPHHDVLLSYASTGFGDLEMLDFLLKHAVNFESTDHRGWNILHFLADLIPRRREKAKDGPKAVLDRLTTALPETTMQKLVSKQSNVMRRTPLHVLVATMSSVSYEWWKDDPSNGISAFLDLYRKLGKETLRLRDADGNLALHNAISIEDSSLVDVLIGLDPDTLLFEGGDGSTCLEMNTRAWRTDLFGRYEISPSGPFFINNSHPALNMTPRINAAKEVENMRKVETLINDGKGGKRDLSESWINIMVEYMREFERSTKEAVSSGSRANAEDDVDVGASRPSRSWPRNLLETRKVILRHMGTTPDSGVKSAANKRHRIRTEESQEIINLSLARVKREMKSREERLALYARQREEGGAAGGGSRAETRPDASRDSILVEKFNKGALRVEDEARW
ncbi:hypothetical protein IE53DRAFT_388417 [Violaceomyces palustris]|uniref:Uncharacterized protein n=1 Tax=Violaceomyces palustris TaxID=1673888 RepID=A0ACD0NUB2_9BASI|nr:hypothetical protein IE53DRAFT_388417 [Violaceomyces palustris]